MAPRKKVETPENKQNIESIISDSNKPLVFVSHDSRDAELAEEFSNLLKSASAGALKSFRSSDKKGTQGIEYGQEWYPAIMEKIDEASDVVCLLTQHSVDRPWILYEAGVAKGKLDKKVIGLVLGIPFSTAITGPFAQFQNNDGDVDSITKLVIDLVKKVPGLDPDQSLVKLLVENFVKRCVEINEKLKQQNNNNTEESIDENSVAKLFEEIKIMFDSLPSRIENRVDPERRSRRRLHPMMLDELIHLEFAEDDPNLSFLMFISFFKSDFPWFYEIGIETYRGLKNAKTTNEKEKLVKNFDKATEMLGHPIIREIYNNNKEVYILLKESRHITRRYLDKLYSNLKIKE